MQMLVTVVRTEIDAGFHSIFATCIHKLTHHVAFAVFPGRIFHTVISVFTGPETETVGMLCRDDTGLNSGFFEGTNPLPAVECRGVENSCRCFPLSFVYKIFVCIYAIVKECNNFTVEPLLLPLVRHRAIGLRSFLRRNSERTSHCST